MAREKDAAGGGELFGSPGAGHLPSTCLWTPKEGTATGLLRGKRHLLKTTQRSGSPPDWDVQLPVRTLGRVPELGGRARPGLLFPSFQHLAVTSPLLWEVRGLSCCRGLEAALASVSCCSRQSPEALQSPCLLPLAWHSVKHQLERLDAEAWQQGFHLPGMKPLACPQEVGGQGPVGEAAMTVGN